MIDLRVTTLGALVVLAPANEPTSTVGSHGRMWQWVDDGSELFTIAVASRPTRLNDEHGVRDHLQWQATHGTAAWPRGEEGPTVRDVEVEVDGSRASAALDARGVIDGVPVRQRLVVASDDELMHVLRLVVTDEPAGLDLLDRLTSAIAIGGR